MNFENEVYERLRTIERMQNQLARLFELKNRVNQVIKKDSEGVGTIMQIEQIYQEHEGITIIIR